MSDTPTTVAHRNKISRILMAVLADAWNSHYWPWKTEIYTFSLTPMPSSGETMQFWTRISVRYCRLWSMRSRIDFLPSEKMMMHWLNGKFLTRSFIARREYSWIIWTARKCTVTNFIGIFRSCKSLPSTKCTWMTRAKEETLAKPISSRAQNSKSWTNKYKNTTHLN